MSEFFTQPLGQSWGGFNHWQSVFMKAISADCTHLGPAWLAASMVASQEVSNVNNMRRGGYNFPARLITLWNAYGVINLKSTCLVLVNIIIITVEALYSTGWLHVIFHHTITCTCHVYIESIKSLHQNFTKVFSLGQGELQKLYNFVNKLMTQFNFLFLHNKNYIWTFIAWTTKNFGGQPKSVNRLSAGQPV